MMTSDATLVPRPLSVWAQDLSDATFLDIRLCTYVVPTSLSPAPVHAGCVASACPPGSWLSVPPASAPDLQASHNNFATLAQNDGGWREEGSRRISSFHS